MAMSRKMLKMKNAARLIVQPLFYMDRALPASAS
jgi:hypothetical protein